MMSKCGVQRSECIDEVKLKPSLSSNPSICPPLGRVNTWSNLRGGQLCNEHDEIREEFVLIYISI